MNEERPFRRELRRLRSFQGWPVPFMDPGELAAAGFYYTQIRDMVRCFECEVEIDRWLPGDTPMGDHQRWQEQCRFIRGFPCGNIPIARSVSQRRQPREIIPDIDGIDIGPRTVSRPSSDTRENVDPLTPSETPVQHPNLWKPTHGWFSTIEDRLKSFEFFPESYHLRTIETLAEAGFFYMGTIDRTSCYYCGGILQGWRWGDDPWVRHATQFPNCNFLIRAKGKRFIEKVGASAQ